MQQHVAEHERMKIDRSSRKKCRETGLALLWQIVIENHTGITKNAEEKMDEKNKRKNKINYLEVLV